MRKRLKLKKQEKLFKKDYSKSIAKIDDQVVKEVIQLKTSELNDKPEPVTVFLQFRSMNAVKKFQKAMSVGLCKRLCLHCTCRKRFLRMKYINETIWPTIETSPEPSFIRW